MTNPTRPIEDVLDEYSDDWMRRRGVVGTAAAECDDRLCIKVYLADREALAEARLPAEVDGYPVCPEVTGPFRAL